MQGCHAEPFRYPSDQIHIFTSLYLSPTIRNTDSTATVPVSMVTLLLLKSGTLKQI